MQSEIISEIDEYIIMFNTICGDIGKHLIEVNKNNTNIKLYNTVLQGVIKFKKDEVISKFLKHIYTNDLYRISILEMDETIFTRGDLSDLTKHASSGVEIMELLRDCWSTLTDNSKKYIKEAMKTLIEICALYVNKKVELKNIKSKNK